MSPRKSLLITVFCLLFITNTSNAVMCPRLKSVSGGEFHTLVLADDNALWACGSNGFYQLGLGSDATQSLTLKQVKGENGVGHLRNIATYDAGWYHSLAADVDGTIWAWGTDIKGQLGNGPGQQNWDVPREVNGVGGIGHLNHIVYVSAGRSGEHSLAVDSNGYVYAWGINDYNQCGDGNQGNQRDTPVRVVDDNSQTTDVYLGDIAHIIQVDAGMHHSLALDTNGHVWHWGSDGSSSRAYPKKVKASNDFGGEVLSNIVQISSCNHSVAVDSNGNVWEWSDSNNAYKVPGGEMGTAYLGGIAEVSAGGYNANGNRYSMARTSDGYVLVWEFGKSPKYVPAGDMQTLSGLLEGIISIAAGYNDHKLAVSEDGYGWAWGLHNDYGQFGVGDTNDHLEPTRMLCAEVSGSMRLTKTSAIQGSDPNCARPGDEITYTITYDADGHSDTDVMIIDYLPAEVAYEYIDPNTGDEDQNYNPADHTYIWNLGTVPSNGSGVRTLTVEVNTWAEPGRVITNRCEIVGASTYNFAGTSTSLCAWNPGVIYVDCDRVDGFNTGMSWEDAYLTLQKALDRARAGRGSEIWVAAGTYRPSVATFQLAAGVPVYGHFAGNETSPGQRNFNNPGDETILTGDCNVVTASNLSQSAILDGFTITDASFAGVKIEKADLEVKNCLITGGGSYGIVANYSNFTITGCTIQNNASYGIRTLESSFTIADCNIHNNTYGIYADFDNNSTLPETRIENSIIRSNSKHGIYFWRISSPPPVITGCKIFANAYQGGIGYCGIKTDSATASIVNNWVYDNNNYGIYVYNSNPATISNNRIANNSGYGIMIYGGTTAVANNWIYDNHSYGIYVGGSSTIRNNTIVGNNTYGIYHAFGSTPVITSCIIWDNTSQQLGGDCNAIYNCIQGYSGTDNISDDPLFTYPEDNDFHLDPNSPCVDTGDPNFTDSNDKDIDGECRISYGKTAVRVDMGADELYRPKDDFDHDDIVNFIDYARWALAWQTIDPNNSLDGDNDVDIDDLAQFCDDWLWIAPWSELYGMLGLGGMDMVVEGGTGESLALDEETFAEVVADEQIEIISQPMSGEQIKELIDWTEQLWQSDPNIREMVSQADYDHVLESLNEQLNE